MRRLNSDLLDAAVSAGLLTKQELQGALKLGRRRDIYLEELLVTMGYVEEADLLKFQANFYQTQFISTQKLATASIDKGLLKLVPQKLAERLIVFPVLFGPQKQSLNILMVQPDDLDIIKEVQFASRVHEVKALVARESAIQAAIAKHYHGKANAFAESMVQLSYKRALADQEKAVEQFEHAMERKSSVSVPPLAVQGDSMDMVLERSQKSLAKKESESGAESRNDLSHINDDLQLQGQIETASVSRQSRPVQSIQPSSGRAAPVDSIAYSDYLETIKMFVALLENNRTCLRGHSVLTARICRRLCERIGLSASDSNSVIAAAYLHDIGKVSAYHLTAFNVAELEGHRIQANKAYLKPIRLFESVQMPGAIKTALRHMYEKFDGTGLPDRLSGKDIPLGARIIAIVDTYTDLTESERNPYRRRLTPKEACEVLSRFSNKVFDPSLVDVFKLVAVGDDLRTKPLEGKWRALLIDPDPEETTVLELKLIDKGFNVTIARNSNEIEKTLGQGDYHVVVSEVDVDPIDGFELLRRLRSGKAGEIPFVFVTKQSGSDMVKRGFDLGASDYITKPTSPDVIALKISQVVEGMQHKRTGRGVSGSLQEMALSDVVQVLFHGRKSGKLLIVSGGKHGEVQFFEGQVFDATYDDKRCEEAFYEMLRLSKGSFELDSNFRPSQRRIQMSPESLLLEGMRRLDEGAH